MKQALLVTNLTARAVSQRLKQVIVKALSADLKLEVADTQARHHATELAQDAVDRGFDYVIAFGGDGTINEVANALVGTDTALAILPGGMANVLCRTVGIPVDIVEATGYLINRVQSGTSRRINVGRMDGRCFVMSCGIGLDASTVRRVEENPAAKRRWEDWFFLYSAFRSALSEYRGKEPYIKLTAGPEGESEEVVLAIILNTPQLTYFKRWPVTIAPEARLDKGLDVVGMRKFPLRYIPPLFWSAFKTKSHVKWKHVWYRHDVTSVRLSSSGLPFPIQVDGEFVGDRTEVEVELIPNGLAILT
jgi:diacylglycerol kinase family enzyme